MVDNLDPFLIFPTCAETCPGCTCCGRWHAHKKKAHLVVDSDYYGTGDCCGSMPDEFSLSRSEDAGFKCKWESDRVSFSPVCVEDGYTYKAGVTLFLPGALETEIDFLPPKPGAPEIVEEPTAVVGIWRSAGGIDFLLAYYRFFALDCELDDWSLTHVEGTAYCNFILDYIEEDA